MLVSDVLALCALLLLKLKKPYLSMNSAVISQKMKEDEEASSFKLTMDHGLYQRVPMVGSVSTFPGSSFFSTSMVTWGHLWGVKTY